MKYKAPWIKKKPKRLGLLARTASCAVSKSDNSHIVGGCVKQFCPHVTLPCVSGGGVPSAGRRKWPEDRSSPRGLHQQEGGQTDCDDCGVRGHTLWGTAPDREKTEGD